MKALLPQHAQARQNSRASNRALGAGGPGGNASLLDAIRLAQNGDTSMLEALGHDDGALLTMMAEATRTEEMAVMGGVTEQGAIWGDIGHRLEETEAAAVAVGGPARPVPESIAADGTLPDALEVNDTGPIQDWSGVGSDIEGSEACADTERVAELLAPELGMTIGSSYSIHLDREAWRVASTYNCDAAIIGQHVFIHRRIEESISEELWGPATGPLVDLPVRRGGLIETQWRPPFAQLSGSDIVMTDGNYTIEMSAPTVIVYDDSGKEITKIWGDPHVNENGSKSAQWHFGEDSTFILPDGTKICCDTEPNSAGEWYTVGVDVVAGNDRFHHGKGGEGGMTRDAAEWDLANADRSDDISAGVFALQDNNQWAVQAKDGQFYDINNESWADYKNDRDIDHGAAASGITDRQRAVAGDADLKARQQGNNGGNTQVSAASHAHEKETHAWFAMQQVEVDAQTGQVVDPLRYMPEALRIFEKGEPNYLPGIDREMNVSKVADNEARASALIDEELKVTMGWYNVHMDEEAWKVAHAYNADLVLWGQEMFVHHDVYQRIEADYHAPPPAVQQAQGGIAAERGGFLMEPKWRAPFLKHSDSAVVMTPMGYTIEMKGSEVIIFDDKGNQETRIWGDPHVNERGGGDNWHFGNDSTFILPDGTKLCLDTKETSPGVFYTVGVDILNGVERYHYGVGDKAGMTEDAMDWDMEHADAHTDAHAGVFALQDNGEWAILADDGKFYDITDETWGDYLKDKDVDFDPNKLASGITEHQVAVADDRDLKLREEALRNGWGTPRQETRNGRRVQRFERLHVEAEVMALLIQDDVVRRRNG